MLKVVTNVPQVDIILYAAFQPAAQQRVHGQAGRFRAGTLCGPIEAGGRQQPHPDRLCGHPLVQGPRDTARFTALHLWGGPVVKR